MKLRLFPLLSLLVVVSLLVQGAAPDDSLVFAENVSQFDPSAYFILLSDHHVVGGTYASIAHNVELVGQIGGNVLAVTLQGSYAYVSVGPRLIILNSSQGGIHIRRRSQTA